MTSVPRALAENLRRPHRLHHLQPTEAWPNDMVRSEEVEKKDR